VHHCQDLVTALDKANIGAMIPQEVTEYFPDESVQQLAQKTDPCAGAKPFRHSHFFDELGQFGSLDQNLSQTTTAGTTSSTVTRSASVAARFTIASSTAIPWRSILSSHRPNGVRASQIRSSFRQLRG
jgi:hypothetical protein